MKYAILAITMIFGMSVQAGQFEQVAKEAAALTNAELIGQLTMPKLPSDTAKKKLDLVQTQEIINEAARYLHASCEQWDSDTLEAYREELHADFWVIMGAKMNNDKKLKSMSVITHVNGKLISARIRKDFGCK